MSSSSQGELVPTTSQVILLSQLIHGLMKTMDNLGGFVAAGSRDCAFWAIVIIAYFSGSIMILRCEGWITDLHAHL
ncbi:Uncharacterized protein TCM_000457 [Theobroma cacao]|uniref:Uncharacterized protein n=1 Tax=Theobroma cacao TaxID=3641 RepID=A0A061DMM1_THECC|nr:Uncharacterized protein TCM_000457 [Theobroma cacao]